MSCFKSPLKRDSRSIILWSWFVSTNPVGQLVCSQRITQGKSKEEEKTLIDSFIFIHTPELLPQSKVCYLLQTLKCIWDRIFPLNKEYHMTGDFIGKKDFRNSQRLPKVKDTVGSFLALSKCTRRILSYYELFCTVRVYTYPVLKYWVRRNAVLVVWNEWISSKKSKYKSILL